MDQRLGRYRSMRDFSITPEPRRRAETRERPESVKRAPPKAAKARKADLPQFVAPQLATLVTQPPRHGDWLYEVKHDGYRMLARFGGAGVRLFTRSGKDWTDRLPGLVNSLEKTRLKNSWLDGEIVVLRPDARSDFQRLQNAFDAGRDADIVYYVFDAPFLSGHDLQRLPLEERRKRLERALKPSHRVRLSEYLKGDAEEALGQACKLGLEGLIGKQAGAVYRSGSCSRAVVVRRRIRGPAMEEISAAGVGPFGVFTPRAQPHTLRTGARSD